MEREKRKPLINFNLNLRVWRIMFCFTTGKNEFDPPSYFQKNLSNIDITLYNADMIC